MHGFALPDLRDHRRRAALQGFPLLRGCPTTEAIKLVLYIDGLGEADRLAFADDLSSLEERLVAQPPASNAEIHDVIRGFPLVAGFLGPRMAMVAPPRRGLDLRVTPVKLLSTMLKDAAAGAPGGLADLSDDPAARGPAAVVAATLDEVVPVEPRRLRRILDDTMGRAFGATGTRVDKETVRYDAALPAGSVRVDVTFAAPGRLLHQFDYRYSATFQGRPKIWMSAYESVWRLASRWDCVTQLNAERSVAHLASLVAACIDLT